MNHKCVYQLYQLYRNDGLSLVSARPTAIGNLWRWRKAKRLSLLCLAQLTPAAGSPLVLGFALSVYSIKVHLKMASP